MVISFSLGVALDRWQIPLIWDLEKSLSSLEKILSIDIVKYQWKYPLNPTRNILIIETNDGKYEFFVLSCTDYIKPWHIILARKQGLPTIFLVAFNTYDEKFEKLLARRLGILYATQEEFVGVYKFYWKLEQVWRDYKNCRCNSNIYDIKLYSRLFMSEIYKKK